MKKKLVFIIPALLLLGFLAIKPPAIGSEKGDVIVTPEAITSKASPTYVERGPNSIKRSTKRGEEKTA